MKVLIFTHGSRGDVQPFVALAHALKLAGHHPVLAAPTKFAPLAATYGIENFSSIFDICEVRTHSKSILKTSMGAYFGLPHLAADICISRRFMPTVLADMSAASSEGADIIVHHINLPGNEIAEHLGVPAIAVSLQPLVVPNAAVPDAMFPFSVPEALNPATYIISKLAVPLYPGKTKDWRTNTLQVPPRRGRRKLFSSTAGNHSILLQAFTSSVFRKDPRYPDWVYTTGFWLPPKSEQWAPPAPLRNFMATHEAPVYVGFGSRREFDPTPHRTTQLVAEAVRLARVPAVVLSDPQDLPDNLRRSDVFFTDNVPHEWLFPRMAAVVHHGGSGTTGAALAAGRPQVVCPFVLDQPFFARAMHASGVAPAPLPQKKLRAEKLAEAIRRAVTDKSMARHAKRIAREIEVEGGASVAVNIIERVYGNNN